LVQDRVGRFAAVRGDCARRTACGRDEAVGSFSDDIVREPSVVVNDRVFADSFES